MLICGFIIKLEIYIVGMVYKSYGRKNCMHIAEKGLVLQMKLTNKKYYKSSGSLLFHRHFIPLTVDLE